MMRVAITKKLTSASGSMILDVDFDLERDSFVALTGVSGSGKTTLLRCISGLTPPDSGRIFYEGRTWFDSSTGKSVPVRKRGIGFVFQDYALFPNMTLRDNIYYACSDGKRTDEFIEMAGLGGVSELYPDKLSSGQKQRCALLRAVSRGPELLLLDEPFSALDRETKQLFHSELAKWRDMFGFSVIMVSHDRAEVVRLADRVIQLNMGRIESDVCHKKGCRDRHLIQFASDRRVS